MFPCKVIQAIENIRVFILAMGEILSSLQIFGSLSVFGVSGFVSKGLFSSVISEKERGRERNLSL